MKLLSKFNSLLILLLLLNFAFISCDEKAEDAKNEDTVDGFTKEDRELLKKNEEKFNFNVEVTRMMDIIINSLYTNKEVFIRELISNSSDACDKARFLAVQNPDYLGDNKELKIIIETDRNTKTFSITDTGVGMTKNDLVKNLGTIAKSGTTSFIEAISKGNSLNLIGQFGVGFYSTYLVSNKVVVTSKNVDDNQHVWVSTAGSSFTVSKDPRGNTLGRGTKITLYLKEDSVEFCETDTVKKNIKKYSEFIDYPIYMKINKTYTEEEETDEYENETDTTAVNETKKEDNKTDDLEIKDEDEEKKKEKRKKKTKSVTKWKWDYELINENKPIWLRDKKEITKEEYVKFYKALTKDSEDPLAYEHGKLEGEVNFRYILFIPGKRPYDLYDNYYGKSSSLKLYVRRVLVSEQFEDLMPRYLNFIKGVVDSDDLPLNVSREALQQIKMIKVMSNKLVKASIQIMIKLAVEKEEDDDEDDDDEDDEEDNETESKNETEAKADNDTKSEDDDEEDDEKEEKEKKKDTKYKKFFENYGKNIKLGVIEDIQNRNKLAKLLRFYSTHNIDELTSFDEYIKRMKPKQEQIYFLAGEDKAAVTKSPLIQKILEKGGEVLILDDPIDEFCLQNLGEYEKKKLKNVAKGEFKLWEEDEELQKKKEKKIEKDFKPLIEWWKKLLGAKVENIVVSQRLTDSPCIMVGTEHGYSASMERIQKAQAFANQDKITAQFLYARKTLEINPNHPAIKQLKEQVGTSDKVSEDVEDTAMLLFENALLESGYSLPDPHAFGQRMEKVLKFNLGLSRDEKVSPYEVVLDDNDDDDDDDDKKDDDEDDDDKKDDKKDDDKKDDDKKDDDKKEKDKKDDEKKEDKKDETKEEKKEEKKSEDL
jgi:heat shock protein beta